MTQWICKALLVAAVAIGSAQAQQFPDRPITILCGFAAGAAADVPLRALGQALSKKLGQPVVVENRPGAAGTMAASVLATTQPDGYTLAQVTNSVIRQPFITKTAFDPIKDFTYVIGVTNFDYGLVVNANSPWKTFDEFLAYAKANPGKVTFGTSGIGSVPHQVMNRIGAARGIEWTHVPYRGTAPAQADLQGGSIDAISDATGWAPQVDAGKFRLLAVYKSKRFSRYPNVPTLKELSVDISEETPWGLAVPKGVPPERVKILHDAIKAAMQDPIFLKALEAVANEPSYIGTKEYEKYMNGRVPIEKQVVDAYGLRQ